MVRTKRAKAVSWHLTPFSALRLGANQDKSFTPSRKERKPKTQLGSALFHQRIQDSIGCSAVPKRRNAKA
jgi:hypothetical protein